MNRSLIAAAVSILPLLSLVSSQVMAQGEKTPSSAEDTVGNIPGIPGLKLVRLDPDSIVLDSRFPGTEVKMFNPNKDTLFIRLFIQYAPAKPKRIMAAGLLEEDSAATENAIADSIRYDSLSTIWSLESWVTDSFPRDFAIPPNGTKTVRISFDIPKSLKSGEYSAHLTAAMLGPSRMPDLPNPFGGGGTMKVKGRVYILLPERTFPHVATKLIYRSNGATKSSAP